MEDQIPGQPNYETMDLELKKPIVKRHFVELQWSVQEISDEFKVKVPTIYKWIDKGQWKEAREIQDLLIRQLAETLAFYADPNTEVDAMAEGNLKLMLKIQGTQLAKMHHSIQSGQPMLGITDTVQKYASALEKLNNTKIKLNNGGVDESVVKHVHSVDMDQALQLALESKKRGNAITLGEAAIALAETQKKPKDAK